MMTETEKIEAWAPAAQQCANYGGCGWTIEDAREHVRRAIEAGLPSNDSRYFGMTAQEMRADADRRIKRGNRRNGIRALEAKLGTGGAADYIQRKSGRTIREYGPGNDDRRMSAKYAGTCCDCGQNITVGQEILWSRTTGTRHVTCS